MVYVLRNHVIISSRPFLDTLLDLNLRLTSKCTIEYNLSVTIIRATDAKSLFFIFLSFFCIAYSYGEHVQENSSDILSSNLLQCFIFNALGHFDKIAARGLGLGFSLILKLNTQATHSMHKDIILFVELRQLRILDKSKLSMKTLKG